MAFKKYAYFNKGNKIAIVEESSHSTSGFLAVAHCTLGGYTTKATCEAAGGQWIPSSGSSTSDTMYEKYTSPNDSVSNGLEIEYSYSPIYNMGSTISTPQINQFHINGWTVIDGYLTFVRSHEAAVPDWTASPYSAVANDEHILIKGSSRWNGLHKVKTRSATGTLQTYTKVNQSVARVVGSSNIDIFGENGGKSYILANNGSNIWLNATFSVGDYIFIEGASTAHNNGMWEISSVSTSSSQESFAGINVTNRYFCYDSDDTIATEGIDTTPDTTVGVDGSVTITRVYRDFCYLLSDLDILEDESFELDLTEYQAQAIVYYIKAKLAEDMRDAEGREYFMRLFNKQMEKGASSRKRGPHIIQGFWGMRR